LHPRQCRRAAPRPRRIAQDRRGGASGLRPMEEPSDFVLEYKEYLERFTAQCGELDFGKYGKTGRGMVKKLRYEEFAEKYQRYAGLERRYLEAMQRGDTVNDAVLKILRESSVELLLDKYT